MEQFPNARVLCRSDAKGSKPSLSSFFLLFLIRRTVRLRKGAGKKRTRKCPEKIFLSGMPRRSGEKKRRWRTGRRQANQERSIQTKSRRFDSRKKSIKWLTPLTVMRNVERKVILQNTKPQIWNNNDNKKNIYIVGSRGASQLGGYLLETPQGYKANKLIVSI